MSRSELAFAATRRGISRYALVHMVAKGMRALRHGDRLITERPADTMNEVFELIARPQEKERLNGHTKFPAVD